jgi:hypothetical protein
MATVEKVPCCFASIFNRKLKNVDVISWPTAMIRKVDPARGYLKVAHTCSTLQVWTMLCVLYHDKNN